MRRPASVRRHATFAALIVALVLSASAVKRAHADTHVSQPTPVRLRVGDRDVALRTPAVYDGRELYLPLEALRSFGATYSFTRHEETALVRFQNGVVAEIALARPGRAPMLPFSSLKKLLGMEYGVEQDVCDVFPAGRKPEPARAQVEPQSRPAAKPDSRAEIRTETKLDGQADDVQGAGSPDDNSAPQANPRANPPAAPVHTPTIHPPTLSSRGGTVGPPTKRRPGMVRIEDVAFEAAGPQGARIRVKTSGRPAVYTALVGDRKLLAVDIASSELDTDRRDMGVEHPFLSAIHVGEGVNPGSTRILLDLTGRVQYRIQPDSTGVTITLGTPNGIAGRGLRDLTIVVDPGHGGSSGTNPAGASFRSPGGAVVEKYLTLAIAQRVRKALEDEGATVLMTRDSDVSVPLSARPRLAIENNADLFVSIHIDDTDGGRNSASGSTGWYPSGDDTSRALASSIVNHIAEVSGLPNRHAHQDHERFHGTGMAVLHCGGIPCTLIEVGFINNDRDRAKLVDPDFQQNVAQAIVEGIRAFAKGDVASNAAARRGVSAPSREAGVDAPKDAATDTARANGPREAAARE